MGLRANRARMGWRQVAFKMAVQARSAGRDCGAGREKATRTAKSSKPKVPYNIDCTWTGFFTG